MTDSKNNVIKVDFEKRIVIKSANMSIVEHYNKKENLQKYAAYRRISKLACEKIKW